MCIAVFIWKAHPLYPFLLFLNRDEYHNRPTKPLSWWEDSDILGGRDEVAGGTWLACTRTGRLSFLTNVREINSNSHTKSRGDLPLRFLKSLKSPHDFSEQLLKEAGEYNGFNLIVADLCSMTMLYITNRPKHTGMSVTEVSSGIHVLSNATLDSPWPKLIEAPHIACDELIEVSEALKSWEEVGVHAKNRDRWRVIPAAIWWSTWKERNSRCFESIENSVQKVKLNRIVLLYFWCNQSQRLKCSFKQLLDEYGESEIPVGQAAERIMRDLAKEGSNLPGIYSPECEYQLSSIFVDTEMSLGRFGTRSTSSLAVRSSGDATFYEVYLEKDVWKEQQMTFVIKKMIDGVVSTS